MGIPLCIKHRRQLCSCRSRKLARKWRSRKRCSSDVHEAMTRWVQSGTHVVPEYPCHNPAFRFFSLTTCRFVPYLLHPLLLLLCTKHVARTAIFSFTPNGIKGPWYIWGVPVWARTCPPTPQGRPPSVVVELVLGPPKCVVRPYLPLCRPPTGPHNPQG